MVLSTGGSETFQDKVNFFQRELRHIHSKRPRTKTCLKITRHSILDSVSVLCQEYKFPSFMYNKLSGGPHSPFLSVPPAVAQSLKATRNFSVSDWSKNFEVVFQDEEGKQNIRV